MKEKWNNFKKLEKISIILFLSALITMILGLILIGTIKDGFFALRVFGVGEVLQLHNSNDSFDVSISHL